MQLWLDASFKDGTAGLGILIRKLIKNGVKETKIILKTQALDNNHAELLCLYHALKRIKINEKIYIITDSKVAINSLLNEPVKKYTGIIKDIKALLSNVDWKIYHRKAHSKKDDVYSQRQEISDLLSKKARNLKNFI